MNIKELAIKKVEQCLINNIESLSNLKSISFSSLLDLIHNISILANVQEDSVSIIQNLARKHKIYLDQYYLKPKVQEVLLALKNCSKSKAKAVDMLTCSAEMSLADKVYNHIINFAKDNNYLDKMSNSDIDNILYIYRTKTSESISIFERVKLNNCEKCNVDATFNKLYNNIMEQFPRLAQICSGPCMQKEDHDSSEISLPDLPPELLGNIFSNLQLQDIILDS